MKYLILFLITTVVLSGCITAPEDQGTDSVQDQQSQLDQTVDENGFKTAYWGDQLVQYTDSSGTPLVYGDISVPFHHLSNTQNKHLKDGLSIKGDRWPNGIVYYAIDYSGMTNSQLTKIYTAINEVNSMTNVRWVRRTSQKHYALFKRDDTVNSSYLGYVRDGAQPIKLKNIASKGVVLHEMMHCMGAQHEHQRSDRDNYIEINWSNIKSSMRNQYDKLANGHLFGIPSYHWGSFDFKSVMLYASYDPSSSTVINHNVWVVRKKSNRSTWSFNQVLSHWDITNINQMYPENDVPAKFLMDVNGDGLNDIVNIENGTLTIAKGYYSNGTLKHYSAITFNPGINVYPGQYYKKGDFNGDGKDDLFMVVTGSDYSHTLYGNSSTRFDIGFFRPWSRYSMQHPDHFKVGDFNNDGRDDIMHFVTGTDYTMIWHGTSNRSYSLKQYRPWAGYGISGKRVLTGDFDGDGYTDYIDFLGSYVYFFQNARNGRFNVRYKKTISTFPGDATLYQIDDINLDNKDDLIMKNSGYVWAGKTNWYNDFMGNIIN